jgi:hypothetical protein
MTMGLGVAFDVIIIVAILLEALIDGFSSFIERLNFIMLFFEKRFKFF